MSIELPPWFPVDVDDDVVGVYGRGHVLARVAVRRVGDDERGLADGAVAEEHALYLVLEGEGCKFNKCNISINMI